MSKFFGNLHAVLGVGFVLALALIGGGVWLLALGGTPYYLVAGVALGLHLGLVLCRHILKSALDALDLSLGIAHGLPCCAHPHQLALGAHHLGHSVDGRARLHARLPCGLHAFAVGWCVGCQHLRQRGGRLRKAKGRRHLGR